MKRTTLVTLALATVALFCTAAAAQQPLEYRVMVTGDVVKGAPNDHFVTLSAAVHLPDVTLAAGTYVFKAIEPSVIQVSSVDRAHVYTMFFTVPIPRDGRDEEYAVTVASRGIDAPPRVKKMVLGRSLAFEPLYDSAEARGR